MKARRTTKCKAERLDKVSLLKSRPDTFVADRQGRAKEKIAPSKENNQKGFKDHAQLQNYKLAGNHRYMVGQVA